MNKLFARTRQYVFSKALTLMPTHEPQLIKGNETLLQIPELLKEKDEKNVLIMTTAGFIKRGTLQSLFDRLQVKGIRYTVYSRVMPDPTIACIEEAIAAYHGNSCEAIVAVGGGSVMDCSKMVGARVAQPQKSVQEMTGMFKIRAILPPIYAVPTTAGTGSEVTAGAVVTDEQTHYKHTVMDLCLVPKYAILDPSLTLTLPGSITAATGMDALTHAVEAYTNRFASNKARRAAAEAVRLIYDNLKTAYEDGQNIQARENLLLGSYYAGIAITNAYVGYVHAIAHAVGGMYGITHGVANAMILPKVLSKYGKACEKEIGELANVIHLGGYNDTEKMQRFIAALNELKQFLDLPQTLNVVKEHDIPELTRRAMKEANPTYPVPVIWNDSQFAEVFRQL
ncbi:MAG: iron-containing alcohol dehydrogenase [Bacteroidaceae bacterium]|nr:iron-containing alcohol dehydrogenase [Bacteroidaceae bacterium]